MKETVYFKSNDYKEEAKDNYTLAVLLSKPCVQYAIYNHFNELKYFAGLSLDNQASQSSINHFLEEITQKLYFSHTVFGVVEEFAVIPEEYFDDSQLSTYLANQLGKDYKADYSYDVLVNPKVRIVYKKDNQLDDLIKKQFDRYKVYNSITPIIQNAVESYSKSTVLLNHFFEDRFDYICLKDGILQMANRYNAKSSTNYGYFLMNALRHNKIPLKEAELYFAGIFNSDHTNFIKQYKETIQYIDYKEEADFAAHKHYNLSVLAKCA